MKFLLHRDLSPQAVGDHPVRTVERQERCNFPFTPEAVTWRGQLAPAVATARAGHGDRGRTEPQACLLRWNLQQRIGAAAMNRLPCRRLAEQVDQTAGFLRLLGEVAGEAVAADFTDRLRR